LAQPHSASRFLWFLRSPAEPLKPVSRPKSSAEKACGPFSRNEQDFVIGGYTDPAGSRSHFGALLAGFYKSAKLQFAGKVGTGFNEAWLRRLHSRFTTIARDDCPFSNLSEARTGHYGAGLTAAEMRRCYWIQPTLVC
jgi:bifunctional non-homologous end joining protein LigD